MQGKCQNADICPYKFLDKENSIVSFDRREIETLAPSSLSNRESDQRERANRLNRRVAAGYSCDTRGTRTGFSSHWNQHEYIYTIGFADRCTCTTRAVSARALLSSLFALSIWVSASNNKRVEHCWKMGRTRRHLSMYRTYKHLLHDAFLFVCVCMESHLHNMLPISLSLSLFLFLFLFPPIVELSEAWHVPRRMNAFRNRHSFELRGNETNSVNSTVNHKRTACCT